MHRSSADRQPADVRYSYFVLLFLEKGKAFVISEYHEVFPIESRRRSLFGHNVLLNVVEPKRFEAF